MSITDCSLANVLLPWTSYGFTESFEPLQRYLHTGPTLQNQLPFLSPGTGRTQCSISSVGDVAVDGSGDDFILGLDRTYQLIFDKDSLRDNLFGESLILVSVTTRIMYWKSWKSTHYH